MNDFAELISKFRYRSEVILLNYQNNYVERSNWLLKNVKTFCSIFAHHSLNFLHNYFDQKLFLTKFLDTSAKFFP